MQLLSWSWVVQQSCAYEGQSCLHYQVSSQIDSNASSEVRLVAERFAAKVRKQAQPEEVLEGYHRGTEGISGVLMG